MNPIIVAPDQGASGRAGAVAKALSLDMATINKTRSKPNDMDHLDMKLEGDVTGRNIVIVDDIADTCGTLIKASEMLLGQGAKSVTAMMTHGVLSGPAVGRINLGAKRPDGSLQDITVYVTDGMTSAIRASEFLDKIKTIPCHGLLYETIKNVAGLN
jgi:ribose-phosphate pyrophosphokinase